MYINFSPSSHCELRPSACNRWLISTFATSKLSWKTKLQQNINKSYTKAYMINYTIIYTHTHTCHENRWIITQKDKTFVCLCMLSYLKKTFLLCPHTPSLLFWKMQLIISEKKIAGKMLSIETSQTSHMYTGVIYSLSVHCFVEQHNSWPIYKRKYCLITAVLVEAEAI